MKKTISTFKSIFILICILFLYNSSCKKESSITTPIIEEKDNIVLQLVSGADQSSDIESEIENPIELRVKNKQGKALEGIKVKFTISEGSISADTLYTNIYGKVSIKWTLGSTIGNQDLIVTAYTTDSMTLLQSSPLTISAIATKPISQDSHKILFLGASYFGRNNLTDTYENICKSHGLDVYIDKIAPGGMYLEDHANSSITASKINERNWDFIVLQGVGSLMAYPNQITEHPVYPAIQILSEKIYNNCKETKIVFCMPWAFEDGMTWYQNWTDDFEDMQLKIYNNTIKYSEELGFSISPVGWAWNTVLKEKNYPLHYLHESDWNHPSLKGSYVMGCTIFSSIFLRSSYGSSYYGNLDEEEANYFHSVASNTVLNDLDLWNVTYNKSANSKL
ncbi:MAG: hypothetical protein GY756_11400 [bacterium]|nr:hypothetical protein [bacterium]